jgi:4-aminobutyrate aminotransferase
MRLADKNVRAPHCWRMTEQARDLDHLKSEGDINLSPLRDEWSRTHLDDETRRLLDEDAKYFIHQSLSTPCLNVLKGCRGSYLIDNQGREILDFHGNNVHQVGFGHPRVIEAITKQMQELPFCTRRYANVRATELAKKLGELAPGNLNKVLFAPGGTSAIGIALKLARAATGRHKVISMWDSFHGASLDAISVGGEAIFRNSIGPLLPGVEHVPPPDPRQCPFKCGTTCNLNCADYIEYVLEKEGDVGAVMAETVRSTPFIPPLDYWKRVRAACDRHGALLILDEIPYCLGRTGKMFACEHYDVVPDILVLGKGLGGGIFPLAAVIARDTLRVPKESAFGHYTHEKNPVACAAALATIRVIEEDRLLERATRLGKVFFEKCAELQRRHPLVEGSRGLGLLTGIELVRADGTRAMREAEAAMYASLTRGLNFKVTMGNILTLTPPVSISDGEFDQAFAILDAALTEVEARKF